MLYPNLIAECGKGLLCGVNPEALARKANITLELFRAALVGNHALTTGEAQAIANEINRCRLVDLNHATISGEYLLSPTLMEYIAEDDWQKERLGDMQRAFADICDLRNFSYDESWESKNIKLVHDRRRKEAAVCVPLIVKAMFNPISYAEYRYLRRQVAFVHQSLNEEKQREVLPAPREIDTKPPTTEIIKPPTLICKVKRLLRRAFPRKRRGL